jgi:hypothetical protein
MPDIIRQYELERVLEGHQEAGGHARKLRQRIIEGAVIEPGEYTAVDMGDEALEFSGLDIKSAGPDWWMKTDPAKNNAEGYELHAWNRHDGAFETIEPTYEEYMELKKHLAWLRGYWKPGDAIDLRPSKSNKAVPFAHYDGHLLDPGPSYDDVDLLDIDEDGDEINGRPESLISDWMGDVTVLIRREISVADAARLLSKISQIIEDRGYPATDVDDGYRVYTRHLGRKHDGSAEEHVERLRKRLADAKTAKEGK